MIHLIIGPVGAGKSTYARKLAVEERAVRLILDDWMSTLYGDDERPSAGRIEWYRARVARCLEQIFRLTGELAAVETNVVLEVGLIIREERLAFYRRLEAADLPFVVWLLDEDRDVRRERVRQRNVERGETFAMHVPDEVFELASDMWQPPGADELAQWDVRPV